ncbi:hypothetical protein B0H11DRAFT_2231860 [Mycena galericulata]|nr:hypothetical protein B0H11DRAFT_2231860 [Mycena galericulata]
MFATISTHFNKLALSRKSRIGLFDFYAALLTKLGSAFVEAHGRAHAERAGADRRHLRASQRLPEGVMPGSTAPGEAVLVVVLYVSNDASTKVFDMAITLLKRGGEHDVRIAGTKVEVAWTALAARMALGPNSSPTPTSCARTFHSCSSSSGTPSRSRREGRGRGHAEWGFLLHPAASRPSSATHCFSRTASPAVQDALGLSDLASQQALQQHAQKGPLLAWETLLRRWVHQCFAALGFSGITDTTQATLL